MAGVVCALLLSALGVLRDVVTRDCALTEVLHHPSGTAQATGQDSPFFVLRKMAQEVCRTLMRSAPEYLAAMFDALDQAHGGVEGYLAAVHGISADELRHLRGALLS